MKKNALLFSLLLLVPFWASAQGWVGNSANNSLISVGATGSVDNITRVGIGVAAPTHQLHTTSGVRFQGLTQANSLSRVLVADTSGVVSWRDAATLGTGGGGAGAGWLLSGNAASASDFIGTTNNQDFRIRTNNQNRMTVGKDGKVAIHNAISLGVGYSGQSQLTLYGDDASQYASTMVSNRQSGLCIYNLSTANNYNKMSFLQLGAAGSRVVDLNGTAIGTDWGVTQISSITVGQNRSELAFSVENNLSEIPTQATNEIKEAMRISRFGFLGIGTTAPTARLHVNCQSNANGSDVRFQNLPVNTSGRTLVVDNYGYVYASTGPSKSEGRIEELEATVASLQAELASIKQMLMTGVNVKVSYLIQNVPNPAKGETYLGWFIADQDTGNATCELYDMSGRLVERYTIGDKGLGGKNLATAAWPAGQYVASLLINGKPVDSKSIVVQ